MSKNGGEEEKEDDDVDSDDDDNNDDDAADESGCAYKGSLADRPCLNAEHWQLKVFIGNCNTCQEKETLKCICEILGLAFNNGGTELSKRTINVAH